MAEKPGEIAALSNQIHRVYQDLVSKGFNHGSAGNISCRHPSLSNQMVITCSGANASTRAEYMCAVVNMDGIPTVEDNPGIPSSEFQMHRHIYLAYPWVQAIVHTHSDACVALSCTTTKELPPFHYEVMQFGGENVRCTRYYEQFGSERLAQEAVKALERRTACLLSNHGAIACGVNLNQAARYAENLEVLVRQFLLAKSSGLAINLLSGAEVSSVLHAFISYAGMNPAH